MLEIELIDAKLLMGAASNAIQSGLTQVDSVQVDSVQVDSVHSEDGFASLYDNHLVHTLVNAGSNAVLILNERREIVFANQIFYDWLERWGDNSIQGHKPGEALHCMHATADGPGCGNTQHCATCGLLYALKTGLRGREVVKECRVLQENSDALDLRTHAAPIRIDGKNYALLTIENISHEKRRHALERVFFHDILNTAGNILGISQLLQEMPPDSREEMVEIMGELADQLVEEIRAQQTLASAESGELFVQMASVDSLATVREVAKLFAGHEVARGRILRVAPESEAVPFDSDPTLLRRVLGNMVKNALEACAPGQTATIGCRAADDEALFWVHNPSFMPRDVQLQMFHRSFSTKGPSRGLGAYSIKLLSERYLQGRVEFASTPEAGTVFYARFPLRLMPAWLVA